ncbi:tektin-like protein 1 [Liolophura sinensis]|uniref:tektin-like protein 1 n=1 Tax=Liolophura sinensis TaxID=3198878 RepID=UPI003158F1CD
MAFAKGTLSNTVTVGPESWRNTTMRGMKLSQTFVQKSDRACEIGRLLDPIPQLRDTVADLSNEEIHKYSREVRLVVARLRESLLETNEEIKSLSRGKEALETSLEHIRKDIQLNKDSQFFRFSRPLRERAADGADDLLSAERAHLLNLKRSLEAQLALVQQQLQVLDAARKRLFAVLQERSRVMDLLCHSISSGHSGRRSHQSQEMNCVKGRGSSMENLSANITDQLGPFTPECEHSLADAKEARARSAYLRREVHEIIDKTEKLQKAAHKSVNDGLTQKLAETVTLKQHLGVSLGENRHAVHRAHRFLDSTEKARGYTLGPVISSDLTTRERLDRPLVRVFQRHPGTQLPEAQEIVRGGDSLLDSISATSRNINYLSLAQLRLREDMRSKTAAASIDSSIIRMRRRKGDHRWSLGAAF